MNSYESISLETHLFFARIMKEHAIFLEAGFPCHNDAHIRRADQFRKDFEEIQGLVVQLSDGVVGRSVLASGEVVTEFTLPAEERTACLTGISINSDITRRTQALRCGDGSRMANGLTLQVFRINERVLQLLDGLISFKEEILRQVKAGDLFTFNYPSLIEHILREARLYRCLIRRLQDRQCRCLEEFGSTESFWNRIMMEHAEFIGGLLDPTEQELIKKADCFADCYRGLLEEGKKEDCRFAELTARSLEETTEFVQFKAAGTKGLTECQIASIMVPLLGDHVLREANHYLRTLKAQG